MYQHESRPSLRRIEKTYSCGRRTDSGWRWNRHHRGNTQYRDGNDPIGRIIRIYQHAEWRNCVLPPYVKAPEIEYARKVPRQLARSTTRQVQMIRSTSAKRTPDLLNGHARRRRRVANPGLCTVTSFVNHCS